MLRGAVLFSVALLGACATTNESPGPSSATGVSGVAGAPGNNALDASHVSSKGCDTIIRDLAVDWSARDYWCEGGRLVAVRKEVLLASLEDARVRLAALQRRAEALDARADFVESRIDDHLAETPAGAREVWVTPPAASAAGQAPAAESVVSRGGDHIVFARGREVLGPRGRKAVSSLADRVTDATHITLRGFLAADEFRLDDPLDAERRSVGRSLSVREAWRSAGLDVSSVTILHHAGHFDAPYVEVVFDD